MDDVDNLTSEKQYRFPEFPDLKDGRSPGTPHIVEMTLDNLTVGKLTLNEVRQSKAAQQDMQVEAVLNWLSPLNMFQRQQDTLSRRHGNTGLWLLSAPVFQRWVNSERTDRTLWFPGNPGTGKAVITSIIVGSLDQDH